MSELAKALLAFQKNAPELHKSSEGQVGTRRYKYLGLDDAMAQIRPALNDEGLVVIQRLMPYQDDSARRGLVTDLIHAESGESYNSSVVLPDTDDMQALGSAITYARRYSLIAILGLVADEDDDGQKASARRAQEPPIHVSVSGTKEQVLPPASEKKASEGTRKMLKEVVEILQKGFPSPDPNHSWWEDVGAYVKAEFGKTASADLTEDEMQQTVLEFERQLVRAQEEDKIPFGDAA